MRRLVIALIIPVMVGCGAQHDPTGCTDSDSEPGPLKAARIANPNAPPADVASLAASNATFATQFHQAIAGQAGNLFYSPFGISLDLAMVNAYQGGNPSVVSTLDFPFGSPRLDSAFDALDLTLTGIQGATATGTGPQFTLAGALWSAYGDASTSAGGQTLEEYYGASMLTGNVEQALSAWSSSVAPASLPEAPIVGACDLAISSIVVFNGAWESAFDPSRTASAAFTRPDGSAVEVPFMNQVEPLPMSTGTNRAIEIPYAGGALSMLIVVPDDLASFEASLSPEVIAGIEQGLASRSVALSLPRFQYTASMGLLDTLQAMGLQLGGGGVWNIAQTAVIQVSEAGTQAAAQTTTSHSPSAVAVPTPFSVNQPFLFFIRHPASGSILFTGRIADPTQTSSAG